VCGFGLPVCAVRANDGMGKVTPIGDAEALAAGILEVLDEPRSTAAIRPKSPAPTTRTVWRPNTKNYSKN